MMEWTLGKGRYVIKAPDNLICFRVLLRKSSAEIIQIVTNALRRKRFDVIVVDLSYPMRKNINEPSV